MKFLKTVSRICYALNAATLYPVTAWDGDSGNRDSDDNNFAAPDARDWARLVTELKATQEQLGLQAAAEKGTAGTNVAELTDMTGVQRTVLTLTDVSIAIAEGSTAEYGSQKIFTFPAGPIKLLGVSINLTAAALVNFSGTGVGDFALGSAAASDQVLAGTDLTWSTDSAAMTVTTVASDLHDQGEIIALYDGTSTPGPVYLNLTMDNGESTGTIIVNGTITLIWANLGDY